MDEEELSAEETTTIETLLPMNGGTLTESVTMPQQQQQQQRKTWGSSGNQGLLNVASRSRGGLASPPTGTRGRGLSVAEPVFVSEEQMQVSRRSLVVGGVVGVTTTLGRRVDGSNVVNVEKIAV
jgi:hypothetical protein